MYNICLFNNNTSLIPKVRRPNPLHTQKKRRLKRAEFLMIVTYTKRIIREGAGKSDTFFISFYSNTRAQTHRKKMFSFLNRVENIVRYSK